jgi:co-chaperonin GroES (HSP10)
MILQPLGTRVLIKRKSIRKVGSIVVPNTSRQMEVNLGEVVSVGGDCELLKEGDLCTFGQYAPHKIDTRELGYYGITWDNDQDIELLLMNEEDALCIILKDREENQREAA